MKQANNIKHREKHPACAPLVCQPKCPPPGVWSASQRGPPGRACHEDYPCLGSGSPARLLGCHQPASLDRSHHPACALLTLVACVAPLSCPPVPSCTALIPSASPTSSRLVCSGVRALSGGGQVRPVRWSADGVELQFTDITGEQKLITRTSRGKTGLCG